MKEYAVISFTKELAKIRSDVFLRDHNGQAMLLEQKDGEPIKIMTSNGDVYYFLDEKNKRTFLKHKKWRIPIVS